MNIHDARARYTREIIRQHFLELLKEKPVAKITVTELCGVCQINRATFYRHYQDIYHLLEQSEQKLFIDLEALLESESYSNLPAFFAQLLSALKADNGNWLILGSENGDPKLFSQLSAQVYHQLYPKFSLSLAGLEEPERKMLYHFLVQGSGSVMQEWIRNGMREPVEEVADFMNCTVTKLLKIQ